MPRCSQPLPNHLASSSQPGRTPPKRFRAVFLATAITAITFFAHAGPTLRGAAHLPECRDALRIAEASFHSEAPYLYSPPRVPIGVTSELVLGPPELDISGGDGLTADPSAFDKEPKAGNLSHRSVYWQNNSQAGYRLVVDETPHGWRGDRYTIFAVPEAMKLDDFIAQVSGDAPPNLGAIRPLAEDSWRPPLVFRGRSGRLWFIDVGQPNDFLAAWSVYVGDTQAPSVSCSVEFRSRSIRRAIALLPPPVRALSDLLDKTIGSGEGEGTMQQTAHLRLEVQHGWANAALRPWALGSVGPYNSRKEVDASLAEWARKDPYNHELLGRIHKQYRLAEPSMAVYYRGRFGHSKAESKRMAAYALDIMFCANFVFDRERNDAPNESLPNPWRQKNRPESRRE